MTGELSSGKVKGVLTSYRWRRRFLWLGTIAALAGVAFGLVRAWPNTTPKEHAASGPPAHLNYAPPKAVRLRLHDRAAALAVASRFIDTAVARKNVDKAWNLVSPEFRSGVTRKEWDQGSMPVVPFAHVEARWKLLYSNVSGVSFSIALFPPRSSQLRAQVFLIGLHQVDGGQARHWVVDEWQPAPTGSGPESVGPAQSNGGATALAQLNPQLNAGSKSSEGAIWLLVPAALLSLIVIIPVGIGTVNWYRGHRARVLFEAERKVRPS